MTWRGGRIRTLVAAAIATTTARALVRRRPPGGRDRWIRPNYRGKPVDLYAAPAAGAGLLAGAMGAARSGGLGLPLIVGTTTGLGLYDDLVGGIHARGLRGHFAALRRGQVTTGVLKMTGMFGGALVGAHRLRTARPSPLAMTAVDAALISGTANVVNLLDLRPGRAAKAALLLLGPLSVRDDAAGVAAAGAVTTALLLLPGDIGERHMLGDCGANGLGAVAGWCLAARLPVPGRALALAVVVTLTLLSERVSFSDLIAQHPALAALDRAGRPDT